MIVVDTSVWINNLRRIQTDAVLKLKAVDSPRQILVGDLVLLEVLQGARDDDHAARLEAGLREFGIVEMINDDLAVLAARHSRRLRRSGITIRKTADLIIASFCIAEGHRLLHDDHDFEPFERHLGLRCL